MHANFHWIGGRGLGGLKLKYVYSTPESSVCLSTPTSTNIHLKNNLKQPQNTLTCLKTAESVIPRVLVGCMVAAKG